MVDRGSKPASSSDGRPKSPEDPGVKEEPQDKSPMGLALVFFLLPLLLLIILAATGVITGRS